MNVESDCYFKTLLSQNIAQPLCTLFPWTVTIIANYKFLIINVIIILRISVHI